MLRRIFFWLRKQAQRLVRLFQKELRLIQGIDLVTNLKRETQSFFAAGARTLLIQRWPILAPIQRCRLRYDHCFQVDGSPKLVATLATAGQGLLGVLLGYPCPSPLTFSLDLF